MHMPHTTPYALHAPADAGNPSSEMMRRDLIVSASSESPSISKLAECTYGPAKEVEAARDSVGPGLGHLWSLTSNLPR